MKQATALAHPNIALVKYWGKRDTALNLPAVGSISITLDTLHTKTKVRFDETLDSDVFLLDGASNAGETRRVVDCLSLLREIAGVQTHAEVRSENSFPTGSGLASSASGFAALVVAADAALDLGLDQSRLSELARRGSGSAARSVLGGFVELHHGEWEDGADCIATSLLDAAEWPLAVTVGVISRKAKKVGSTAGMELTRETSSYYSAWVDGAEADLLAARVAIVERDFQKLADVSELSCLKMHALAMSSQPGLMYWHGATVEGIHRIRQLRRGGHAVFFTIDAGPQLKVISTPEAVATVTDALSDISGVQDVLLTGLGEGARVVD
ncbi:MAG: diphosphomevalonate decarboxylase [Gammaproteobacteria bacterium]|nr:diphosphomevalonate decarboxylase [Gammaproteobacteria bacterium]MDH3767979.1 diphosphomevalonate decarboxylase [Gammaproteobacteria bacterium]